MKYERGFAVIDPGHTYELDSLDSSINETSVISFVKRVGKKFPGNKYPSYSGTTLQIVLRVLINRVNYLDHQVPCIENKGIKLCLKLAVWLLELRAAKHNGLRYFRSLEFAHTGKLCEVCGHTICNH